MSCRAIHAADAATDKVRNHGDPVPGVVVCWQHAPVHNVTTSEWVALVIGAPFDTALTVSWVGAERLIPIRDDTAVDG
jgi:hypothetical protein